MINGGSIRVSNIQHKTSYIFYNAKLAKCIIMRVTVYAQSKVYHNYIFTMKTHPANKLYFLFFCIDAPFHINPLLLEPHRLRLECLAAALLSEPITE